MGRIGQGIGEASRTQRVWRPAVALLALLVSASLANADGDPARDGVEVETLADGLGHPTGLALRPGGSRSGPNLLIAETAAGRVVGLSTDNVVAGMVEVITGYADKDEAAPEALAFRSRNRLLVAQAARGDAPAQLTEYDLDDERLPMPSSERNGRVLYNTDEQSLRLSGLARNYDSLVVATGDHEWLLRARLVGSLPSKLSRFIKPIESTQVGRPTAVTFSDKGYLVVGESGPEGSTGNARVVFRHPVDMSAEPLLSLETSLDEIAGLAYSPTTGELFAAAVQSGDKSTGVFRIDAVQQAGRQGCHATLVAELARPTAMAFDDDGVLYVTTSGGEEAATGTLERLTFTGNVGD